ncbi:MAG: tetratricopeptide repeat protein [Thermoanaerobaculia bacterium]
MSARTRTLRRCLASGLALALVAGAAWAAPTDGPAAARELIEAGQPEAAAAFLDSWLQTNPDDAGALLQRSTARFMLNEMETGRRDLERALELDPTLRQGWLNRAALDLADGDQAGALEAFRRAEALDPAASDNSLNIGAVLLLQGELDEASQRFGRYLAAHSGTAEASYLVATNYAMAGYVGLSLGHLQRAVDLDERSRLRARNDPNFSGLAENGQFQSLLLTDGYAPPPGAHRAAQRFEALYDAARGPLLGAVLDALQTSGLPYDPRIEVNPDWALVWSELRIKVSALPAGGQVELSAPAERFTPQLWQHKSEALLRQIAVQLVARGAG